MKRRERIFREMRDRLYCETDRMFGKLLVAQWVFAIGLALMISPWAYSGEHRTLHAHVKMAIGFGALINACPLALIWLRPGWWGTRHVIAAVQMLWSAVLIMITNGRIETHFHVFGSLAFIASYRDWRLLSTATVVVAIDHLARGLFWPDSVYGIANPEWWRFLEHAGWVVFEDVVLVIACARGMRDIKAAATRAARLENTKAGIELEVQERTRELEASVGRYRALVENTAAIPFVLDAATLRVTYIAPQAIELLDCSAEDLANDAFFNSVCHPDDLARVHAALSAFARGEARSGEPIDYRIIAKSGRNVCARTLLSSNERGQVHGITLDITRQLQLETELQHAQKLESVGRLAAGVAHEINTPIQFVSDSVQFVRDAMTDLMRVVDKQQATVQRVIDGEPAGAAAAEATASIEAADLPYLVEHMPKALDRAIDGLDRVAVIVRSMKVFAHQSGEVVAMDLATAIGSTLIIARNEYRYVADVVTDFGELPPVWCHAGELNQVILNIVMNATHAISDVVAAGARGTITIRTRHDGEHAVISISDTGGGIPEAVRTRIFDPFFTTKSLGRGTGQGLAIARAVVERHHGSLTFETALGAGTTFHIRIPIQREPLEVAA